MKTKVLFLLALTSIMLTGCDQPSWLNVQADFYDRDNAYLESQELVWANQLVPIPAQAVTMEIQISSRTVVGTRLPFDYSITAVENGDGFQYVLAEGHQSSTSEPVFVSVVVRDSAGRPMLDKFQAEIEAAFTVDGPYHHDTPWTAHRSFTAIPEELIEAQKATTIENWKTDWGGVLHTLLSNQTEEQGANPGGGRK